MKELNTKGFADQMNVPVDAWSDVLMIARQTLPFKKFRCPQATICVP